MLDLFAYDQTILSALTSPALSAIKPFFFALTELGSPTSLLIYSALVIALGNMKLKKIAAVLAIAFLLANLVTTDIKDIVQRSRPYAGIAPVYLYTNDYSLPSGHTVAAFLAATIILAYFGWKWGLASYVVAALIGISRIVLDVHYPSDVLAGAAIGVLLGAFVMFAAYRLGFYDPPDWTSRFIQMKNSAKKVNSVAKKPIFSKGYYLAIIAMLLVFMSLILNLGYLSYGIAFLAIDAILLIYAMPLLSIERAPLTSVISVILVGTISAYATMMLGSYILSLAMAAFTYLTILLLSVRYADLYRPNVTMEKD
jgi:undecaprenyl-diphosphatase